MINVKDLQNVFFLDEQGGFDWIPIQSLPTHVADDEINVGDILKIGRGSKPKNKQELIDMLNQLSICIEPHTSKFEGKRLNRFKLMFLEFIDDLEFNNECSFHISDIENYRIAKIDGDEIYVEELQASNNS